MKVLELIKRNRLMVLVGLAYLALLGFLPETAGRAFGNSVYYLKEMVLVLPVIFVLTVFIEAWVPKETIIRHFGEKSGLKGSLLSLALGSLSAGPIYAAFPLSKTLLGKGASIANIVIVLSAWAVIKVPMLANEAKFLGLRFMAIRWVLTVLAIFGMAFLIDRIVKRSDMGMDSPLASERQRLAVNQEYCVGCKLCAWVAPGSFEMNGKKARIIAGRSEHADHLLMMKAAEKCPVKAIVYDAAVRGGK